METIHWTYRLVSRADAPISSSLNAIDLYLVVCIIIVFGALLEYAAILLLLKKKRIPLGSLKVKEECLESSDTNFPSNGVVKRKNMKV